MRLHPLRKVTFRLWLALGATRPERPCPQPASEAAARWGCQNEPTGSRDQSPIALREGCASLARPVRADPTGQRAILNWDGGAIG